MLIKVCGMKSEKQIRSLENDVDYIGFIFYDRSPRFVENTPLIENAKKIGVFVNAELDELLHSIEVHSLDCVQLHGNESPEFCKEIRKKVEVMKAFGVDDSFSFQVTERYESSVDYFLFDTKTSKHGGSGRQFNWDILSDYKGTVSFLLSGGIRPDSLKEVRAFRHPKFIGIDLNSGFERAPGDKQVSELKQFIKQIKNAYNENSITTR